MSDAAKSTAQGALAGGVSVAEPVIDRRSIPADAVETRWPASDGHSIRRIDWPGRAQEGDAVPRGSILFMPGRGDHYEKYLETLEEWHRDGWRVTASDWRGQSGSGRLGNDDKTGHIDDFDTWTDDLAYFWQDWVKQTPGPHILAAHSMGGHLIMRAMVDGKITPDAAILSAPMLGMAGPPLPLPVLHGVAKVMTRVGDPKRQAWGDSEKPGAPPSMRANLLTSDPDRYEDEQFWRRERPEVAMGPASWGWVERAYASWRVLEADGAMEAVDVPVLIVSTSADKLVSHAVNVRAVERLPKGRLIEFGDEAQHEILREKDAIRGRMMDEIAAFLDEVAPPR